MSCTNASAEPINKMPCQMTEDSLRFNVCPPAFLKPNNNRLIKAGGGLNSGSRVFANNGGSQSNSHSSCVNTVLHSEKSSANFKY